MSRFKEAIIGNHEFAVKYGRPKTDLPLDVILELKSKGYNYRDISKELKKMGFKASKDTVNRRVREAKER